MTTTDPDAPDNLDALAAWAEEHPAVEAGVISAAELVDHIQDHEAFWSIVEHNLAITAAHTRSGPRRPRRP